MTALLLIDIQYDFLPGGSLAVPEGDKILPEVQELLALPFDYRIATQDYHPAGHSSFTTSNGPWPEHCVQGTYGANLHPSILHTKIDIVIRKGTDREIDSYSAFFDNDRRKSTELEAYLKERGIKRIAVCGLATDYCVLWSVLDALSLGFQVDVIADACRGIHANSNAFKKMEEAGARLFKDTTSYRGFL